MKHYIDRFKRGYKWESKYGATTPIQRAGLSLMFFLCAIFLARSYGGWTLVVLYGAVLVAMWVGVTISSSKDADAVDKPKI